MSGSGIFDDFACGRLKWKDRGLGVAACAVLLAVSLWRLPATAATGGEEAVSAPIPGGHLAGTLLLPDGDAPFPVALLIAGSGPTDRDGNAAGGLRTDAYKKLAQGLAARGIATLRYDKRFLGTGAPQQSESQLRLEDLVDDALTMCALLESDKRFASVSIIGHSEGALIGTLAAQRDPHIRSLISLEGPGRNLAAILNEQVRANPANPPEIVAEVERINAALLAGNLVPDPNPLLVGLFRPSVQPYLISEYRYDPAAEIAKVTIPTLIVQGTSDLQVGMPDAHRLAAANPHATLTVIDGMNHVLVDAPADRAGNFATYVDPALPLHPQLIPAIAPMILGTKPSPG